MWCLCRLLPLMIGDKIPEYDLRWHYILVMMHIKGTARTTTLQDYCSDLTSVVLVSTIILVLVLVLVFMINLF